MSKQQRTLARALRDRLSIRERIAPRGTLSDYMTVYRCYMSEDFSAAKSTALYTRHGGEYCMLLSLINELYSATREAAEATTTA
nr:MAG TPA: hypothetical protein [Caudoviricetes sp.]